MIIVGSVKSRATHIGATSIHLYSGHVLVLEECLVLPNGLKNIGFVQVLVKRHMSLNLVTLIVIFILKIN